MARKIKTKSDGKTDVLKIGGWLDGKRTFLWFGDKSNCYIGSISGRKLYRLAMAIVKEFGGR